MNKLSTTFQQINSYFDYCINMICSRCSKNPKIHHEGLINTFLKPVQRLPDEFFDKYFEDVEHGLFHGIMCGFIISLIHKDKNLTNGEQCIMEKELCSAFLHDILKCNGFSQEKHDICLSEFYPELKDETYKHSNPPVNLISTYLIISDRIELSRYDDSKLWIDERYTSIFSKMEDTTRISIEQLYSKIRKTLLYFYINSDKIFIRHGIEKLNKCDFNKEAIFPPANSYLEICKGYPIEIDRPTFGIPNKWGKIANGGCSNHDGNQPWNKVKGYILFEKFCNLSGNIIDSKKRDHLYATSEIKLKDWCFMYQNIEENDIQIIQLIENDIDIIPQEIVMKFYMFNKLLKDRMRVLNYCL